MTTIVTRSGKGSPLTHTEVDTNFTNLNTAKLETAAIPLGTLQAPSVSFLNDSDTGIFCPQGGNSLAIATGGQYAITCSSTQAVGIKTANPQGALQVAGSTRIGANDATDAFLEIGEGATGNRNSYIDIVGDTTYTDYGLRVIRNNTGANATSELKHRGTGALNFTTEEAAPIVFYTTNSPRLTILAGGSVGIGTSSPGNLLHVESSFSGTLAKIKNNAGSTSADTALEIESSTTAAKTFLVKNAGTERFYVKGDGTSYFNGSVGIGTTSPAAPLEIISSGTAGAIVAAFDGTASKAYYQVGGTTSGLYTQIGTDTSTTFINDYFGNGIAFQLAASEKARIDSSGSLLVGTSTARTYTTGGAGGNHKLQLETAGATGVFTTAGIYSNSNEASLGAYLELGRSKGTSLGAVTAVAQNDVLGEIRFAGTNGTAANSAASIAGYVDGAVSGGGASDMPGRLVFSTTADEAASPTERMRITSGGYLKQSPTGSYLNATGLHNEFSANNANSYVVITSCTNASPASEYIQDFRFSVATPNDTSARFWNCTDATAQRAYMASNGGLYNYSANNSNLSDRNAKKDITPAADTWDCIKEWEIVNYRYKDQPDAADLNLGVIAQQVAESCPEVIAVFQEAKEATEDQPAQEERLGVKEQQMYWMAIKALQEAQVRIEALEARLTAAGIE
jgi:hypothetical protein